MNPNRILLPLIALAGLACASKPYATPPETPAQVATESPSKAAATSLPEIRYYAIADT